MSLPKYLHVSSSVFHEFQLFLFGFFDNVNKSTGELSRTLLYFQYWKATARFQIYQYEDVNNKGTVSIQLVVYSYTLFSCIRTYYNFSLDIPEMRYVFFSSTEDVYDTLFVSILFSFSLTRKWAVQRSNQSIPTFVAYVAVPFLKRAFPSKFLSVFISKPYAYSLERCHSCSWLIFSLMRAFLM